MIAILVCLILGVLASYLNYFYDHRLSYHEQDSFKEIAGYLFKYFCVGLFVFCTVGFVLIMTRMVLELQK